MKWLLAGCASVVLASGAAFAGPCSDQIAALQQTLSSRDAGAGPVQMKAGGGTSSEVSEAGSSVRSTSEASRSAAEVRAAGQDSAFGTRWTDRRPGSGDWRIRSVRTGCSVATAGSARPGRGRAKRYTGGGRGGGQAAEGGGRS